MSNYGFIDARTSAELLMAPAVPLKRIKLDTSSLSLDLGGLTSIPGAISDASQITGAIRGTFSAAAIAQSITSGYGSALNATVADLKSGTSISASVDPMFLKNSAVSVSTPGLSAAASAFGVDVNAQIPGTNQFIQFSALRPGQIPGVGQLAAITDRTNQIQGLASRFTGLGASPVTSGVRILENMHRIPYPLKNELNIPSFPRLSTGGPVASAEAILKDKTKFVVRGVKVAQGKPGFWSRLMTAAQAAIVPTLNPIVGQAFADATNRGGWSEPAPPYAAQYPYNKVTQTESGHMWEMDDTPGAERVHIFHRSGSFIEMHPNGTVVYKSMKDGYILTMANQNVKISGKCNIYVGGDATLYAKGNLDVESGGEINFTAKKDFNVFAKNINLRAKQTFKGDGKLINLRYINLPDQVIPVWGALVPIVNMAALALDFPTGNFAEVVRESMKGPLDEGTLPPLLKFQTDAEALAGGNAPVLPPDNPLSNPAAYTVATAAAGAYRARLFDAPEETENFEMYSAHMGLQQTLGDIAKGDDPRELGGKVRDLDTDRNVTNPPTIDYLDFNAYAGQFVYTADHRLGNTSFTLADLVDTEHASEIVAPKKTPTDAAIALGQESGTVGPLNASTADLTQQGMLGSGGVSGGLPTQAVGTPFEVTSKQIPEGGISPWQS